MGVSFPFSLCLLLLLLLYPPHLFALFAEAPLFPSHLLALPASFRLNAHRFGCLLSFHSLRLFPRLSALPLRTVPTAEFSVFFHSSLLWIVRLLPCTVFRAAQVTSSRYLRD